jgi:hypothetical protein
MFGKEVNQTAVEAHGSEAEQDICTAASKDVCKEGVESGTPGQFYSPSSTAVDPANGDIYVAEVVEGQVNHKGASGDRVQKFTPEGHFVLEIGEHVNEMTQGYLCTHVEEEEGVKCAGPALLEIGAQFIPKDGSFGSGQGHGNLLAVGAGGELYVGDVGRVQEFAGSGEFNGEVALEVGTNVDALALDASGDLYLTSHAGGGGSGNIVKEFEVSGAELSSFEVKPEVPDAEVQIQGLAVDSEGHLAVTAIQNGAPLGSLYEASTGTRLTAFRLPESGVMPGIAFNAHNQLYVASEEGAQEILQYSSKPVAALTTVAVPCTPGAALETDLTVNCTLTGEVNPEGVSETEAWFDWGRGSGAKCELASTTSKQALSTTGKVEPLLEGLRPNETYCYQLVAEDADAKSPEALTTELASFTTELVPPRVLEVPQAQFVKASSVVMFDQLNPENAKATYFFEYAAVGTCPNLDTCGSLTRTSIGESSVYGSIGVSAEAVGLRPDTEYNYRLFAENENSSKTEKHATISGQGSFTTARVSSPSAETGVHGAVGVTSARVSATVTPDGAPVTYSFELGVYEGANTQYGVVSSGTVEADSGPVEVSLPLSGLQPGTTYAYRIAISSGYIDNETHTLQGQPETFVTSGLPAVLQAPDELAQLGTPNIAIPRAVNTTTKKKTTDKNGKKQKKKRKVKKVKKKGKKAGRVL